MKYKTQKISMKLFLISMAIVFVSGVVLAGCGKKKDLAALASPTLSDSKEFGEAKDVAIFYEDDPTQDWNYGKLYAIMVRNLLGHFNTNVSFINVDDYHRKELDDFDAAIYISTIDDYPLNDYFLGNVYSAKKPFMWINWNISQFFEREDWPAEEHFGFDFKGVELVGSYSSYIYKDKKLPSTEEDSSFYLNKIDVGAKSQVLGSIEMLDDNARQIEQPDAIRCGNFFYVAHNPLEGFYASYIVFSDLLHDLLNTDTKPSLRALVRFEDLTPGNVNYKVLRSQVDALYERGIPFEFGVIPLYIDPLGIWGEPGKTVHLYEDFLLQDMIKYMISKGGMPVMHGYTHQHDTVTALDYEFFDGNNDKPFPEDSYDWALDRIDKGIAEFEKAVGFSPAIWETPHYSATPNTYMALAQRFNVLFERVILFNTFELPHDGKSVDYNNIGYIQQTFPYQVFNSYYGLRIIPANLGYLEVGGERDEGFYPTPEGKEALARMYTVVRDGVVGFYFHHWQPEEDLIETIERLQNLGYTFISVQDLLDDVPPVYK